MDTYKYTPHWFPGAFRMTHEERLQYDANMDAHLNNPAASFATTIDDFDDDDSYE